MKADDRFDAWARDLAGLDGQRDNAEYIALLKSSTLAKFVHLRFLFDDLGEALLKVIRKSE